jgi:hypothetical protein
MKKSITIGDKYGPAMKIADQAEADRYFEKCVQHNLSFGEHDRTKAESVERSNLGYYAGYYDHETRERVERLFRCAHPVFGKISAHVPTQEEAFAAGVKAGKAAKEAVVAGIKAGQKAKQAAKEKTNISYE